jgi:demethylmenaquinone methyltransferase/2-methoxy-6-polyprenyl-1,4-benzoquinol methylase
MSTTVFMKLLESTPSRYDRGIQLLTWGAHQKILQEISTQYISENDQVLDLGVGTATFAILCAKKGAHVTGIDISPKMLTLAKQKVEDENLTTRIDIQEMSAIEMDTQILDQSYDKIIATLVFSELTEAEQLFTLKQCQRILKGGGLLILEDEVKPSSWLKKVVHFFIRLPLALFTYLIAQVTTTPLKNIEQKLIEAQFRIESKSSYFLNSLVLIVATKEG